MASTPDPGGTRLPSQFGHTCYIARSEHAARVAHRSDGLRGGVGLDRTTPARRCRRSAQVPAGSVVSDAAAILSAPRFYMYEQPRARALGGQSFVDPPTPGSTDMGSSTVVLRAHVSG